MGVYSISELQKLHSLNCSAHCTHAQWHQSDLNCSHELCTAACSGLELQEQSLPPGLPVPSFPVDRRLISGKFRSTIPGIYLATSSGAGGGGIGLHLLARGGIAAWQHVPGSLPQLRSGMLLISPVLLSEVYHRHKGVLIVVPAPQKMHTGNTA